MLGQIFLLACLAAAVSIAAIFFVLFGPVPVKKRVTVVPRLASAPVFAPAMPSLVSQLAPAREQHFTPTFAVEQAPVFNYEPPTIQTAAPVAKPKGQKVQPLPKKRSAKGTGSPAPFAPVVRSRPQHEERPRYFHEEEVATSPVRRVSFDSGEMTTVDDRY